MKKKLTYRCISLLLVFAIGLLQLPIQSYAASFKPGGGPSSTGVLSVNHIDIGIDLSATVLLNNELTTIDITLTTEDAQYVSISANPETEFSLTGGITTSTDNSGNSQIRIEGDFPIGTKTNPIYYTVTLSKTISAQGIQIPIELSATMQYWDTNNVYNLLYKSLRRRWSVNLRKQ